MYTFRQATDRDFEFLFALHRESMRAYIEPIWGWHEEWQAEYFRQKFEPAGRRIIRIDGTDAGVLVVEERPGEMYIALIELLPKFQGRGVGTAIINRLKAEASDKGLSVSLHVLNTNKPARRLYERLGFRASSEEQYRIKMVCEPAGCVAPRDHDPAD